MSDTERRRNLRHEIEIGVTIRKEGDEKIAAAMVNISRGGVGLISDREILPGEEVNITLNSAGDYAIQGSTRWKVLASREGRTIYRLGVEADQVLAPENLLKGVLTETGNNE